MIEIYKKGPDWAWINIKLHLPLHCEAWFIDIWGVSVPPYDSWCLHYNYNIVLETFGFAAEMENLSEKVLSLVLKILIMQIWCRLVSGWFDLWSQSCYFCLHLWCRFVLLNILSPNPNTVCTQILRLICNVVVAKVWLYLITTINVVEIFGTGI